ncbi:dihydrofolate reductase family protein [Streptomyces omiyaensis]|uniref:Dihydrofolate reductase family protein n=1 Tax=Streptomyces omiyaensis TaxID=68247 RepID=A0ABW7BYV2_9ACTN
MRKLVYYIGVTLDGRIAGPDGQADFFPVGDEAQAASYADGVNALYPETVPAGLRTAAGLDGVPRRRFDTVLMGGATYRLAADAGLTSPYPHLRQYVVSATLAGGGAADPAVTVVPGDPVGLVRRLKREGADGALDLWLCGGGRLAGALLPEIDELVVKSYPVIAGAGLPVVDGAFDPTAFEAAERTAFPNGVTLTRLLRR